MRLVNTSEVANSDKCVCTECHAKEQSSSLGIGGGPILSIYRGENCIRCDADEHAIAMGNRRQRGINSRQLNFSPRHRIRGRHKHVRPGMVLSPSEKAVECE